MQQEQQLIPGLLQKKAERQPKETYKIELNVSTWVKDSHGLYDYMAGQQFYKKQKFCLDSSSKVYRDIDSTDCFILEEKTDIKPNSDKRKIQKNYNFVTQVIFGRSKKNPKFTLRPQKHEPQSMEQGYINVQKTPFLVVNSKTDENKQSGYPLKPGKIIKLGRVGFMVIEMKVNDRVYSLRDTFHFQDTNRILEIDQYPIVPMNRIPTDGNDCTNGGIEVEGVQQHQKSCKVCLCDEECDSNPLISPCKCKGSCSVIHIKCLITWIDSKVKRQVNQIATTYNFTKFECEICKQPFPKMIRLNGNQIEMMTINKPDKPYIILESLNQKSESKEEKTLHLITAQNRMPVRIGRGHQCEIRMGDISVSRAHAEIVFNGHRFLVRDTDSKFGTLVRMDEDVVLERDRIFRLQYGRTLYEFKVGDIGDIDTQ